MNKLQKMKMFFRSLLTNFGAVVTDKGKLVWDGNEDLKEGMQVFVENPEADDLEYEIANAGNYTTEDGKIITVNGEGIVETIEDPNAEVAEETIETPAEMKEEEKEEKEEKTEEIENAEETVENPTNEGEETDTEAIVKLREEVNELFAKIGEYDARLNSMEDMLRKLSETPAAMSATEQVTATVDTNESLGKQRLAYLRK